MTTNIFSNRLGDSLKRVLRVPRKFVQAFLDARKVAPVYNLSTFGVMWEQLRLYREASINFANYYHFRLFDPRISREEKSKYLPTGTGMEPLWNLLTPGKYRVLFANKLLFKQYFKASDFPLAKLYGIYHPVFGYTVDGRPLKNATDLQSWMQSANLQEFVIKPIEGDRGNGVLVLVGRAHDDPNMLVTLNGDKYDAERIVAFIEEHGVPDPKLSTKNTSTVGPK